MSLHVGEARSWPFRAFCLVASRARAPCPVPACLHILQMGLSASGLARFGCSRRCWSGVCVATGSGVPPLLWLPSAGTRPQVGSLSWRPNGVVLWMAGVGTREQCGVLRPQHLLAMRLGNQAPPLEAPFPQVSARPKAFLPLGGPSSTLTVKAHTSSLFWRSAPTSQAPFEVPQPQALPASLIDGCLVTSGGDLAERQDHVCVLRPPRSPRECVKVEVCLLCVL